MLLFLSLFTFIHLFFAILDGYQFTPDDNVPTPDDNQGHFDHAEEIITKPLMLGTLSVSIWSSTSWNSMIGLSE